jgi:hypothetical protein
MDRAPAYSNTASVTQSVSAPPALRAAVRNGPGERHQPRLTDNSTNETAVERYRALWSQIAVTGAGVTGYLTRGSLPDDLLTTAVHQRFR